MAAAPPPEAGIAAAKRDSVRREWGRERANDEVGPAHGAPRPKVTGARWGRIRCPPRRNAQGLAVLVCPVHSTPAGTLERRACVTDRDAAAKEALRDLHQRP